MKDYSMNLVERKDFVLGYHITDEGKIEIKFAKGKPWIVPYNKENEKILLDKMKEQLGKTDEKEKKLFKEISGSKKLFIVSGIASICLTLFSIVFNGLIILNIASVLAGLIFSSSLINFIYKNFILSDLSKNKQFLEMEEKLNTNVRNEQNVFVNVSKKTRNVVKDFPEDKPVFNINSFNYVPFSDLEKIMENAERNKRFGFNYTNQEEPYKGIVRKKVR